MQQDAREAQIVSAMFGFAAAIFAPACRTPAPPEPTERPLITRHSEPMVPRPSRPAAEKFEVTEELRERVAHAVTGEEASNQVLDIVGLAYPDGQALFVTHMAYPYAAMSDAAAAAAYDEEAMYRCRDQFSACVSDYDACDDAAFDACARTAYTNPYMYASHHLIVTCGIIELSRYSVADGALRLVDRVVLQTMACDFETTIYVPAAKDVDLDHGPELAFTYAFTGIEPDQRDVYTEMLTIVDAADLHVQARLLMRHAPGEDDAATSAQPDVRRLGNVTVEDRNADGLPDLVRKQLVATGQFCPEIGWTGGPELLVAGHEADACDVTITETILPYDPATDVWKAAENAP